MNGTMKPFIGTCPVWPFFLFFCVCLNWGYFEVSLWKFWGVFFFSLYLLNSKMKKFDFFQLSKQNLNFFVKKNEFQKLQIYIDCNHVLLWNAVSQCTFNALSDLGVILVCGCGTLKWHNVNLLVMFYHLIYIIVEISYECQTDMPIHAWHVKILT